MENDEVQLVIARLNTMPSNITVNLGDSGVLEKSDLIKHVKKQDELGQKIVHMQLRYLRALKDF
jgi:hypothetical protein